MTDTETDKNTKTKTLFITHVGKPGGAELKMINFCKALMPKAEAVLFQDGSLRSLLEKEGIPVSVFPMPGGLAAFRREDGVLSLLRAIPAIFRMIGGMAGLCRTAETVVCVSQKAFILAALAKPFSGRPVVWLMNDILSGEHFSRVLIFLLVRFFAPAADQIILNSQASMAAWRAAGGREKNVHIIYPGIDVESINESLKDTETISAFRARFSPDGKPVVGIFGRISPWKGQDVFLKAIAKIPDVNAVIVGGIQFGEDAYAQDLKMLARDLGIEDRVLFTGHTDEVPKAMAACDVIAHCSTSPEPFGLVIVEAMACGVPVIASDAGGAQEIIAPGENGWLTPMGDEAALADKVKRFLEHGANERHFIAKAREDAITKFSTQRMINSFSEAVLLDSEQGGNLIKRLRKKLRPVKRVWKRIFNAFLVRKIHKRFHSEFLQRPHNLPGELIVTVTSYLPRFPTLRPTLECLLSQSMKPDRVILWVAEGDISKLPEDVRKLETRELEIRTASVDYKVYNKFVHTMRAFPEAFVVTADDDVYYSPDWLEKLVEAWDGRTDRIVSHRAHYVKTDGNGRLCPYREWGWEIGPCADDLRIFPTGGGGVLYPPGCFAGTDLLRDDLFTSLSPNADDVWLFWMGRMAGVSNRNTGHMKTPFSWPESQIVQLCADNVENDRNDAYLARLSDYYGLDVLNEIG